VPAFAQHTAYNSRPTTSTQVSEERGSLLPSYHSASSLHTQETTRFCTQTSLLSAAGKPFLAGLSVMFNPHLHVPTQSDLGTAPRHSLDNILHVPTATKRGKGKK